MLTGEHSADAEFVLDESVRLSMRDYGEAARDVYDSIFGRQALDAEIEVALNGLTLEDVIKAMFALSNPGAESYRVASSHKLISVDVSPTSSEYFDQFAPKFKSDRIARRVLQRYAHLKYQEAKRLFNVFRSNPESGITTSWIFEGLVHGVLCGKMSSYALCGPLAAMRAERGSMAPRFVAEQEFDSGTQHLPIRPRAYTTVDFSEATFAFAPLGNMVDLFCVPKAANNPLFDSFFVELKTTPPTAVV